MQPVPDSPSTHRISIVRDSGSEASAGELPFVIGVLADFSVMPEPPLAPIRNRRFVDVHLAELDQVLSACSPRLALKVENTLSDDDARAQLNVELNFRSLEDFDPDAVVQQIAPLRELLELRTRLADLRTSLKGNEKLEELLQEVLQRPEKLKQLNEEIVTEPPAAPPASIAPPDEPGVWSRSASVSVLDELVAAGRPETPQKKEETRVSVKEFLGQVFQGDMRVTADTEMMINSRIAALDNLVSVQLREVLHHEAFQRLEASWRGLHFLLRRTRKFARVKVRILNITRKELAFQFQHALGRYDAPVSRMVMDHAAGTPGVEPFSLLIADYETGRGPEDDYVADKMARLGAAAHVPLVVSAAPGLLGLSSFTGIGAKHLLHQTFDAPEWTMWNRLRERTESRYLGVVLPRMLARLPHSRWDNPVKSFDFDEGVNGSDHSKFLWASAVWAFAARQAADFERYGWFGIRVDGDRAAMDDLPAFVFETKDKDLAFIGPVETAISDSRYLELRALGLIPLCKIAGTNSATFFEAWSCHKPTIHPDWDPPTTYESAEIECVLAVSRIAHYLRCILQEERQRFSSVQDCEEYLRRWIATYVVPDYARDTSFECAFPLLSAELRIAPGTEPNRPSLLEASLLPARSVGRLSHPVTITVPVVLPWALALTPAEPAGPVAHREVPAIPQAPPVQSSQSLVSARDQFIRRMLMAEGCITKRKLDVAVVILEELAEQIERHHLDEWESPQLVTHVWDLLRRCYLITGPSPNSERPAALLRRICRLDPSRVIE